MFVADKYINPTGLQTIKEYVDKGDSTIPFGIVDSTSTSTAFTATVDGITALIDGTCVLLKNGVVTSAAGFTININNLGAKPVYNNMAAASAETTIFNINYTMMFIFDSTRVSGGAWICYRGYNSDTTVGRGVIDYYYRPYAGQAIYRYKLCMQGVDNRLYPIVTTNQTSATQVKKRPTTIGLRASAGIWYYGSTSTVNEGSAVGVQLLYPSYYFTSAVYNFNTSTGTYKNIYLRGNYNRDTDLFTLYDDGATTTSSYYTFVPNNTANIDLSTYFVEGYYYILVGSSYSTTNYVSLFDNNPIYYFDGTNLVPVSTKVAQDVANTAVAGKQDEITANGILKGDGNGGVSAAVSGTDYQAPLTFDNTPTTNSTNPVTSGGIYTALSTKQNTLTFDNTPTANSDNPVKSSGIKSYIDTKAPFFTIELYGESNPTLQEILQRIDNGETPLLVTSSGEIILTSATKVYSDPEEWLIGLTWVIVTVLYGQYVMGNVSLTNNTLTPEQTYDSSQDTWGTGQALSGIVDSNELATRLAPYLPLSGGNMTGDLYLLGDPTSNLQATTKQYVDNGLATKQNSLTFDTTPTANSVNPVTSGGIYTALQNAGTKIYVSATEPANWNAGDWWYEEVE
jgi:hypothetical protein